MNIPVETTTQVAARILMNLAKARSQWIEGITTPAEPELHEEVLAQTDAYLDLLAGVPAMEAALIKGNLFLLDRAATAGNIPAANKAYAEAEAAGVFN